MPYLDVPAASLYYETSGRGPLLLCISGATGDLECWKLLVESLKNNFTVVTYDRRGFSRSFLSIHEPQDYDHRLDTDADDVARLIKHLSGDPAIILGNSFGALVALQVLLNHPDVVKLLIAHEPQAVRFLSDSDKTLSRIKEIHNTYRKHGMPPAYRMLAESVKLSQGEAMGLMEATNPKNGPYNFSNAQYFWEREVLFYPFQYFDIDGLESQKGKLLLANSQQTDPDAFHYRPNIVLAEQLGLNVETFPGGHMGALTNTQDFAQKLEKVVATHA